MHTSCSLSNVDCPRKLTWGESLNSDLLTQSLLTLVLKDYVSGMGEAGANGDGPSPQKVLLCWRKMAFPQNADGLGIRFGQDVTVCVRTKASAQDDPSKQNKTGCGKSGGDSPLNTGTYVGGCAWCREFDSGGALPNQR